MKIPRSLLRGMRSLSDLRNSVDLKGGPFHLTIIDRREEIFKSISYNILERYDL